MQQIDNPANQTQEQQPASNLGQMRTRLKRENASGIDLDNGICIYTYGWPRDENHDARCALNAHANGMNASVTLTPDQALAVAAGLVAAARLALGEIYDPRPIYESLIQE